MPPPTYPRARQNRSRRLAGADHLSPHAPDAFRARVANDAPTRTRTAGLTRKLRLGAQPPPQRHPHRRAGPSASWPACRCQRPEREGRSASTYRGSAPLDVAGCTSGRVSGAINAVVASWLYVRGLFRIPNLRLGPYDTFASSFRDVDDKGKVLARHIWKLQVLVCEIHLFRRWSAKLFWTKSSRGPYMQTTRPQGNPSGEQSRARAGKICQTSGRGRKEEKQRMQEQPASSLPSSSERSSSSVHHMEMDLKEGKLPLICLSFCCRRLIWFTASVLWSFNLLRLRLLSWALLFAGTESEDEIRRVPELGLQLPGGPSTSGRGEAGGAQGSAAAAQAGGRRRVRSPADKEHKRLKRYARISRY
jgi:hypothetical protein